MGSSIDYSALPLRDIHLPEPISWWPPAPGWWLLLAAMLVGVALLLHRHYRKRRHRAARSAIERIAAELEAGAEPVEALAELSIVLRRFAMSTATAENADSVPGLVGRRWLEYLDTHGGGTAFREGAGRRLLDAPYLPKGAVGRQEALEVARLLAGWVHSHRTGG